MSVSLNFVLVCQTHYFVSVLVSQIQNSTSYRVCQTFLLKVLACQTHFLKFWYVELITLFYYL